MSAFHDLHRAQAMLLREGVHGRLVHGERMTLLLVELDPGAIVPEHSHPHEQVGILLEGSAEVVIGDERLTLAPGGAYRIDGSVVHVFTAGPEGAVLVECFSPPREDWSGLAASNVASRWPG